VNRSRSGFTLLEVLAAVVLLGTVYTVLAGVAIRGLKNEGTARRRLEASLIADEQLAQIELQIDAGAFPISGPDEVEMDIFVIEFSDEEFAIPLPPSEDGEDAEYGIGSLLGGGASGAGEMPMRRYELRVTWLEGVAEYEVVRTTFGFDALAADWLPTDASGLSGLDGLGGDSAGLDGRNAGDSRSSRAFGEDRGDASIAPFDQNIDTSRFGFGRGRNRREEEER
jgi:prepilin-type N-terminal cleavage/methylation domain-containing protein